MKLEIDHREIIKLDEFSQAWRWAKTHNPDISEIELSQLLPVTSRESEKLNDTIEFFEKEENLIEHYSSTDWIDALNNSDNQVEEFQNQLTALLSPWEEDVIVTWDRTTSLITTKEIFIKYWDDFCYPGPDDTTIISIKTNWIMQYRHYEVANIWTKITPHNSG